MRPRLRVLAGVLADVAAEEEGAAYHVYLDSTAVDPTNRSLAKSAAGSRLAFPSKYTGVLLCRLRAKRILLVAAVPLIQNRGSHPRSIQAENKEKRYIALALVTLW